ncbi:hypothetical protein ACQ4PT_071408 [Festuca glaucescens]
MELLTILVKMASLVSNACRDAERLPVALISCGVVQAAAALCLLISRPPGGIFLHHGKAPFCLYYAILIAVFVFGLFEASAGFWVSSNLLISPLTRARALLLPDLMEAAEDASLEPAIAWLVQTILATLLVDKLDTWIRQVGFGDDIERLKSEIRRVGMVVSAVKGRAIGNEPLAQFLAILKELLYDADDVVDELDYYRLQQQVQGDFITCHLSDQIQPCFCGCLIRVSKGVDELDYYRLQQQVEGVTWDESEGMHGVERVDEISRDADTPNSSVGKLRSVVWQHFKITEKDNGKPVKSVCRYCAKEFTCETKNGTSSMSKHINKICKKKPRVLPPNLSSTDDAITNAVPVVIGDSCSRKRRRVDEDSTQITASNTQSPWDKDILSSRITWMATDGTKYWPP